MEYAVLVPATHGAWTAITHRDGEKLTKETAEQFAAELFGPYSETKAIEYRTAVRWAGGSITPKEDPCRKQEQTTTSDCS